MNDLQPINVILTAAGCPGASTCIRHLQGIQERTVRVIGVDAQSECIGRFLADSFERIPPATDSNYIPSLLDTALRNEVNCVLIASSYEVEVVAPHVPLFEKHGVKVLVSSPESLLVANNKLQLYEKFRDNPKVLVPEFIFVNSLDSFVESCMRMGYPNRRLCFKPPASKGSRGFRYLSAGVNRADLLMNYKPDSKIISLEEMIEIFKDEPTFPDLILMEAVEGEEIDSMILALNGDPLLITHKTREAERGGVIVQGGHVDRPEIEKAIRSILEEVPLSYNVGIQFKGGYLMEINPRLSSFMYTKDWVEPYFAIKLALGEYSPDDVRNLARKIPMELRMVRYFDQYFFSKNDGPH